MPPFKAIIFDFDGTLSDTETFHFHIWNEILAEYNIVVSYEEYLEVFAGVPTPVNTEMLVAKHNLPISKQALLEKRENLALARMATAEFNMMPHARETLDFFFKKGIPMALATGSPRPDVDLLMKRMDLAKYFEITITRDDVAISKPDPESYQKCVDFMGLPKHEYLVFEDTPNGSLSAKNAGLTCFAVQHDLREHPRLQHADKIFLTLEEALVYLQENKMI